MEGEPKNNEGTRKRRKRRKNPSGPGSPLKGSKDQAKRSGSMLQGTQALRLHITIKRSAGSDRRQILQK